MLWWLVYMLWYLINAFCQLSAVFTITEAIKGDVPAFITMTLIIIGVDLFIITEFCSFMDSANQVFVASVCVTGLTILCVKITRD
jgi:hypothetical protein